MMDYVTYFKGGIWKYDMTKYKRRGIMEGVHPVIIISKVSNPTRPCQVLVCPISHMSNSVEKHDVSETYNAVPMELVPGEKCFAVVNQIFPAVTSDLYNYKGQVTGQKLKEIDRAIAAYLQLDLSMKDYSVKQSDTQSSIKEDVKSDKTIDKPKVIPTQMDSEEKKTNNGLIEYLVTLKDGSVKLGKFYPTSKSTKLVLDQTSGIMYNSNKAACVDLNINETSICRGIIHRKPVKGHLFLRIEKEDIEKIEENLIEP